MSKIKLFLCAIVIACALVSCNKKSDTFMLWGVTECYSDFLFCDYEPVKMTRTLCFEVNDEMAGKNWKTKFGLFKKKDNGSYVPVGKEVVLYKNGELCANNVFEVTSEDHKIELGVEFTPTAEEGVHKWYLKVLDNGGFDRINEYSTAENTLPLLLEWKAEKKNVMNPLFKGLIIFVMILIAALVLWFIILKNIFYPTFKMGNIQILGDTYFSNKRINKARMLVATSSNKKQSALNRIFTGKIVYERNEMWNDEWELYPKGKKARIVVKGKYILSPMTMMLDKQVDYQMEHLNTGNKVKIALM